MYDLYFGDEKSMPCNRQRRFKNPEDKESPGENSTETLEMEPDLPVVALPDDIKPVLTDNEIFASPFSCIRSKHSSRSGNGDALAIAYPDFMVLMWRKEGDPYTVLKVGHSDFSDITAAIDEVDDDLITMSVITEEKTYRLWFNISQSEEVVEFVNGWKIHLVHNLNKGKQSSDSAPEKKESEQPPEVEEKKPQLHSSVKMYTQEPEGEAEIINLEEEPLPPEVEGADQYNLPKTVIFGTLLLDQMADGKSITEHDLEMVHEILGNPDLLALCIKNFKQADIYSVIDVVRDTFSSDQKVMLMTNLADLAYRNGEPHENELKDIENMAIEINMLLAELKRILKIFMIKNDPEILNY